jgi:tripartite-type tricarboxylate transporter receptor subunit TctC
MESRRAKERLAIGVMAIILACAMLWGGAVFGQETKYPSKPIEVIVPFSAGGPTDVWTRIAADELSKELGVSISIQYKPGAGGVTGAIYIVTQKPDGYTLLSGSVSSIVSAPFFDKVPPYDVFKDFTPISACVNIPNGLMTHASSNFTSLDDVVKFAKENPGKLNCVSAGVGTTAHLVIEVLRMYGIDLTHVPAKGGGPAATTLLGKHVDLGSFLYSAALPYIKSGDLRILATTDKIEEKPGVPTYREKGYPEAAGLGSWQGFFGPGNLPKPIRDQLAKSLKKVIQMPSIVKALKNAGFSVEYKGPDELEKKIANDYESIGKVVKAAGLGKYAK